jgi:uncharacterized repeat protein (TIGR03803 family)
LPAVRLHRWPGGGPDAGLIKGPSGKLYGTTVVGGAYQWGTVFELTPNAARTTWTETVLHSFCAQENCADGSEPSASVIRDASGNLYGTTQIGGAHDVVSGGGGTVFELTPNGTISTKTVLYSFCALGGASCTDGAIPLAGLIIGASGNLYGTTAYFGAHGYGGTEGEGGTVFELKR